MVDKLPEKKAEKKLESPAISLTNVAVVAWGDALYVQTITKGKIVVTKGCQWSFFKGEPVIPALPALEKKVAPIKIDKGDPFAGFGDIQALSDEPLSLDQAVSVLPTNSTFAIGYEGELAPKAHWRQTVWRSAAVIGASSRTPIVALPPLKNLAGVQIVFSSSSSPTRILDAGTKEKPYYDMHLKTPKVREDGRVILIDQPGGVFFELFQEAPTDEPSKVFLQTYAGAANGNRIESVAHFDTYLCVDGIEIPLYHVRLTVLWEYMWKTVSSASNINGCTLELTKLEHRFEGGEVPKEKPKDW